MLTEFRLVNIMRIDVNLVLVYLERRCCSRSRCWNSTKTSGSAPLWRLSPVQIDNIETKEPNLQE